MRRLSILGLMLGLFVLSATACVHVENKRTKDSRHVRVRAPFTHVDVDVPKDDDDEKDRDVDVDVR